MHSRTVPSRVGPYSVERLIGEGGCARVVLGRHESGRLLALKIMPGVSLTGTREAVRFRREIKILAGISHPNLVRILDAGFDGEWFYYGMEYMEGGTVQARLQQGTPPPSWGVALMHGLAEGVGHLHQKGVIHRDIKPSNILLGSDQSAKVSDLGLARMSELTSITSKGTVLGTLRYMTPEMFQSGALTAASDIYQLGLVFYEVLTGMPAQRLTDSLDTIRSIMEDRPPPPSSLTPSLSKEVDLLLELCLSKDPRVRPQNGTELRELLASMRREGSLEFPAITEAEAMASGTSSAPVRAEPPAAGVPPARPENLASGGSFGPPVDVLTDELAGTLLSQRRILDRLRLLCVDGPYLLRRIAVHRTLETLGFAHYVFMLKARADVRPAPEHPELEFTVVLARDGQGRIRTAHLGPPMAQV